MPIPTFSRQRLRPSRDRPEEARELSREGSQCGARAGEGAHDAGLSCGARAAEAGRGGQPGRDLPSLQGFHIEAKITQACKMFSPATLAQWDAQAQRDSEGRSVPLVIHRWSRQTTWWVRVLQPGRRPTWVTLADFVLELDRWR